MRKKTYIHIFTAKNQTQVSMKIIDSDSELQRCLSLPVCLYFDHVVIAMIVKLKLKNKDWYPESTLNKVEVEFNN